MAMIPNHPGALPGETAYEWFTDDLVAFQRDCPHCDKGLIYAPVRFCGHCGGDGHLIRIATSGSSSLGGIRGH